ncbi:2-keto-4-pentenoate hydratase [Sphingomonas naphthae]|uniref:2-keto-4-pentenoate hydratase n=1 Tax=Sphingomonas naphthae TaxID=1813468 RepID=A0ABY7TNV3_9SPHN|nr:2-keto-4-pentenoate hydratase [Sphingomonas naphthae]WCT74743.1 2-keto-4-pentenoate hydratase [Sphingomonas naphthae]
MATQQIDGNIEGIAKAFVTGRQTAAAVIDYPGTKPASLDEAYAVQDSAIGLFGGEIVGWKVGRINPPLDGVDRLSGPIFAHQVFDYDGSNAVPMAIFADGFGAAESEFLIQVGTAPDPAKLSYTMDEAIALIGAVHVGIEIASSPFPGINGNGPLVTISDFGNNNGLVVGPAIEGWQAVDLNAVPVELHINGERIGAATAAAMLDGPIGAARFLFEHLAARGIAVPAGTWISSGAVTGVHVVGVGDEVEARFDDRFSIRCTITAA